MACIIPAWSSGKLGLNMHIEVEEKVMAFSKPHLLDKQHENEILMLKREILSPSSPLKCN